MDKAYDLKLLVEKLKGKGLDLAEEAAKVAVEGTLEWLEESAKISANPYDDLVIVLVPVVKPKIFEIIDKIDGQVG
jgi:hypothetical protein